MDDSYPGCPLEEARRRGEPVELDYYDVTHDRHFVSGMYPTHYATAAGQRVFLHSTRDVTAQRRAEARVERSHEAQRLVNDLLRTALHPLPLDNILEQVTDRLMETGWLGEGASSRSASGG